MNERIIGKLETNNFSTNQESYINPEYWLKKIVDFQKSEIIAAQMGKNINIDGLTGDVWHEQFNSEISASALTENSAITPSSFSYTQVNYTPTEYGLAVSLTRKERVRSIQDIMSEKARDMGYALAKKKDQVVYSALQSGALNTMIANDTTGTATVSNMTTSHTLVADDFADARAYMRQFDYEPKALLINPSCLASLEKAEQFTDASIYGGRETVLNGEVGKYLGVKVLSSTLVPENGTATPTAYDNFMVGSDSFGIAQKMPVRFDRDYNVLDREFILAAVEEYAVSVRHGSAIVKITAASEV